MVNCTKSEAAARQLDSAICLFFTDHDPLAIRTLVSAAHGIFSDLVEKKKPGNSWRSRLIEDSGLSEKEAIAIINSAQNYLKHADRDPESELSFDEIENDYLIFFATIECGELGYPLSIDMQAYQIWYLAAYPGKLGDKTELVSKAKSAFPNIESLQREKQLMYGKEFIEKLKNERNAL